MTSDRQTCRADRRADRVPANVARLLGDAFPDYGPDLADFGTQQRAREQEMNDSIRRALAPKPNLRDSFTVPKLPLLRGDVVYVDLSGATGNEKQGRRPCVVVGNDGGNRVSPLTIVAPITDSGQHRGYPVQVFVSAADLGPGAKDSVIECGHLRDIDRDIRIDHEVGVWCHLDDEIMERVDEALRASLGL